MLYLLKIKFYGSVALYILRTAITYYLCYSINITCNIIATIFGIATDWSHWVNMQPSGDEGK